MDSDLEAVFARRGPLSHLPEARRALLGNARRIEFGRGEPIVHAGDMPGGIFGIVSGGIACEATGSAHGPVVTHIARAGDWFGEGPVLTGDRRTMSFKASEDSLVLQVPLAVLRNLAVENPAVAQAVAQLGERAARTAIDALCDLLIPEGERRLAAVLLRITAAREGLAPDHPEGWRLTQADLAAMANLSRGHASEMLLAWQRAGLIRLGHARLAIANLDGLLAIADQG